MPGINKRKAAEPSPPLSGTLTFLFTDVEGSTRLWEARPQTMSAALARHDAIVRSCVVEHRGQVFKTVGDAFCAVFATATDALGAALAVQQALHAEPWPTDSVIRVRMALHTGAAELRDNDYFGSPLNQVARLLAVGHGGQTLVSEITRDLCQDRLPAGVALKSLGDHVLKDLPRRQVVYQLCHPDIPQAFPPLKTLLAPADATTPSIAVLPFADLSPQKDQEFFTDGLAEELLNVLCKVRGLRVASRTSAFYFKGKDVDVPTIAQKLGVETILEGSVRTAGRRVRITAQLIRVATDSLLWSAAYDRELEDIFAVQDDIAQSVVKELRSTLLGDGVDAVAEAATKAEVHAAARGRGENAEAYRLYLQGRFFEDRLTSLDNAKAMGLYEQALRIDPQYALAWAGLSRAHCNQAGYSWDVAIAEGFARARDAVGRALDLDPCLAEAHAALGQILRLHDWDWKGADASFRRALELAPGNARIMGDAGRLAGNLGRPGEALTLLRTAVTLDPLSASAYRSLSRLSYFADLLDEAEMAGRKSLELDPQGGLTRYWLGLVHLAQGRVDEAREMFDKEPHATFALLGLSHVHHACGRNDASVAALQQLIEKDAVGGAYQIALGFAYRGEKDAAFEWLERAYVQRDPGMGMMKMSHPLRNLHDDARWQPLLQRMGLAD